MTMNYSRLVLENKSTARNLNEKSRSIAAMSKLQNLTLWKEVNKTITHGKHFQMICQKVYTMIQPSQNFQFILDQAFSFKKGHSMGNEAEIFIIAISRARSFHFRGKENFFKTIYNIHR